jgi:hypothetical protein
MKKNSRKGQTLQDTAERGEFRPGIPAEGEHQRKNDSYGDEMHSSRVGESDTTQTIETLHENLLPAPCSRDAGVNPVENRG